VAKTVQSRKAKGRRLQQLVRDRIIASFPELTLDDVRSTSMGAGGTDVLLSAKAKSLFPYAVECKAQEGYKKLYDAFDQANEHSAGKNEELNTFPLLVIKSNNKEPLAVVSFDYFMRLVKRQ